MEEAGANQATRPSINCEPPLVGEDEIGDQVIRLLSYQIEHEEWQAAALLRQVRKCTHLLSVWHSFDTVSRTFFKRTQIEQKEKKEPDGESKVRFELTAWRVSFLLRDSV